MGRAIMIRFLIYHIVSVVAILTVARRTLTVRGGIPTRIRWCHYVFTSYLVFMNVSGLSQASWTLGRLLKGEMIARMGQYFIALRELPPVVAVVIWDYCVIGRCITALLVLGLARSNGQCRAVLLKLFPLLVLAQGVADCINVRGSDGVAFVQSRAAEYVVAFCVWCLFAWPYFLAYRFYRGTSSDILFADSDAESAEADSHAA